MVSECTVAGCSYEHHGCHASAITVDGAGADAQCATFIPLDMKGGLDTLAAVGACQPTRRWPPPRGRYGHPVGHAQLLTNGNTPMNRRSSTWVSMKSARSSREICVLASTPTQPTW